MKTLALLFATLANAAVAAEPAANRSPARPYGVVIHGGAGVILREKLSADMEAQYRAVLQQAIDTGYAVLERGGSSLDAITAAIPILEDSPLFNAGKGAVFTHEGKNELDAAIMDGRTMKAGAVAGVTIIRNPITAARAVMEKTKHVMLIGRGAEYFATKAGLEIVDPSYFWTERRWKSLQQELVNEEKSGEHHTSLSESDGDHKYGTVGCVALDRDGNLAAGTSTGGTTNKQYGRVGDSPIIGAGTYAANDSVAVSATGEGEFFIRWTVAYDIAALVKYKGMSVRDAAEEVINRKLTKIPGAEGGVIALDRNGNFATPFNTEGMYRGWIGADGEPHVEIYRDEK